MEKLTVFAPAKVNLYLAVKDRRPDGFHDLQSVFLSLNFGDTLHFTVSPSKNITEIAMTGPNLKKTKLPLNPEKNIIYKAVSLFREKTGFSKGLKIKVDKRIPIGGGLGGGSSDAASALLALNRIADSFHGVKAQSRESLLEIAATLGSDVPFFIYETSAAWVTGRGDVITPIKTSPMFFVLVSPGFHSGTKTAFRLLDEYRRSGFYAAKSEFALSEEILQNADLNSLLSNFHNDFLEVFPEREKSAYNGIIGKLRELGAEYANLSGSGSACFGVFKNMKTAQKAAEIIRKNDDKCRWFVESCQTFYL